MTEVNISKIFAIISLRYFVRPYMEPSIPLPSFLYLLLFLLLHILSLVIVANQVIFSHFLLDILRFYRLDHFPLLREEIFSSSEEQERIAQV